MAAHPARSTYLGSSDIAAVIGVSRWATPLDVYRAKVEPDSAEVIDIDKQRILRRGHRLEPFIVQMAVDELRSRGHEVRVWRRNARVTHRAHRFLSAELDAVLQVDGAMVNLEAKSASRWNAAQWGEPWTDEIPTEYSAQVQMAQALSGRDRTFVAAVIGLDDVTMYEVPGERDLHEYVIEQGRKFWVDHVLARRPPPPQTLEDLDTLYPSTRPHPLLATAEIIRAAHELRTVRAEISRLQDVADEAEFIVREFLGAHDTLMDSEGRKVLTAREQTRRVLDTDRLQREQAGIYLQYLRESQSRPLRFPQKRR